MSKEIVNRVANSKLVTFDLEDYYPEGKRVLIDIKDWLYEGLILKEKEFRAAVSEHDWKQYQDAYVALYCFYGCDCSWLGLYAGDHSIASLCQTYCARRFGAFGDFHLSRNS